MLKIMCNPDHDRFAVVWTAVLVGIAALYVLLSVFA